MAETATLPGAGTPRPAARRRPGVRRTALPAWLWHLLIVVAIVVVVYPVVWMLGTSFKPATEVVSSTLPWPTSPTTSNYPQGWSGNPGVTFATFFANSAIISAAAVVGNLIACSLTAYAFARLRFRARNALFAIVIGTLLLPYHVLIIPQYAIFRHLGWINTFWPLIVPKFLAVDAFFVFLMVQFMRGIPRQLDEAARIDGCGPFRTYWYIVLPLARPALITTSIFTFIWTWNDFFSQLIYLNDTTKFTVPVGLNLFVDQAGFSSYGPLMAMAVLSVAPIFLFFLAFQRLLVEGVATTGLKG
ncbi:MAG TPA: carbohydrate ABC transporter permease [Rugosimonospora sp.]|nr:carbohydrate ABC transporter permease [Rugosimonospora sp.]